MHCIFYSNTSLSLNKCKFPDINNLSSDVFNTVILNSLLGTSLPGDICY